MTSQHEEDKREYARLAREIKRLPENSPESSAAKERMKLLWSRVVAANQAEDKLRNSR
jgi:hypothetical protein